jgi:hypothetical protein
MALHGLESQKWSLLLKGRHRRLVPEEDGNEDAEGRRGLVARAGTAIGRSAIPGDHGDSHSAVAYSRGS